MSNCLTYWFPRIRDAGLPVPRTEIVTTAVQLWRLADGEIPDGFDVFIRRLQAAADTIGYPCFLRTGHTSGKHEWDDTCHLPHRDAVASHVCNLVEWSALADPIGLPTNVWAVRELLPTTPLFTAFRGMPICREVRCFARDGRLVCRHPYWPRKALEQGFPLDVAANRTRWGMDFPADWQAVRTPPPGWPGVYDELCRLSATERQEVVELAERAGAVLPGDWSVDILETTRGWCVTDTALAARSYHWESCELAEIFTVSSGTDG